MQCLASMDEVRGEARNKSDARELWEQQAAVEPDLFVVEAD